VEDLGSLLVLQAHAACVQDHYGTVPLLKESRPFIQRAFADSAHTARKVAEATSIAIDFVRKPSRQIGFVVHPQLRVAERLFAGQTGSGPFGSPATP
jgi:hypothetical protein